MVKGTKRQIIFLSDLKKAGKGIFECAYFILRPEYGDSAIAENEMLAEAERIVESAERLRNAARAARHSDRARSAESCGGSRSRRGLLLFICGFLVGALTAGAFVAIWRLTHT